MDKKKKSCSIDELVPIIEDTIKSGGVFPLTVTGTSMTPTLFPQRDSVSLISTEKMPLQKYDIILFRRENGKIILHRVIKLMPSNKLLINGDCQTWTEVIDKSQVIAVAKSYSRHGKIRQSHSLGERLYSSIWCKTRAFRPALFKLAKIIYKKIS